MTETNLDQDIIIDSIQPETICQKQVAIDTINSLYEKYANDPYMSDKTHNYIFSIHKSS